MTDQAGLESVAQIKLATRVPRPAADLAFVFASRALGLVAAFAINIVVARSVGPGEFGLFAFSLAAMWLLTDLSGTGVDLSMVRVSSAHLDGDHRRALAAFTIGGMVKTAIGMPLMVGGVLASGWLAGIMGNLQMETPLRFAFVGGFVYALMLYAQSVVQAHQRFNIMAVINGAVSIGRVAFLMPFIWVGRLTISVALSIQVGALALGALWGLCLIPKGVYRLRGVHSDVWSEMYHFAKWAVVMSVLGAAVTRLDILMMGYFRTNLELGVYAAAATMALPITTLTYSVTTVFIPKVSRLENGGEFRRFLLANFKLTGLTSLGLIAVALPAGSFLLTQLYGSVYAGAVPMFQVLALAFACELFLLPPALVLFGRNRLDIVAKINGTVLLAAVVCNIALIPAFGGLGAAVTVLAGKLVAGAVLLYFGLSYSERTPLPQESDAWKS